MSTAFGRALRFAREQRAMSQSKLALAAGFDHSYVSRLESGSRQPTRDSVLTLSQVLKLDAGEEEELLHAAGFISVNELSARRHMDVVQQLMTRAIADPVFAEAALKLTEEAA